MHDVLLSLIQWQGECVQTLKQHIGTACVIAGLHTYIAQWGLTVMIAWYVCTCTGYNASRWRYKVNDPGYSDSMKTPHYAHLGLANILILLPDMTLSTYMYIHEKHGSKLEKDQTYEDWRIWDEWKKSTNIFLIIQPACKHSIIQPISKYSVNIFLNCTVH